MRTVFVVIIVAVLGCLFLVQKRHEQKSEPAPVTALAAPQTPTPRPVSEHNWARHALDTTRTVTRQVAEQRKQEGNR